jgi:hypothetical protein
LSDQLFAAPRAPERDDNGIRRRRQEGGSRHADRMRRQEIRKAHGRMVIVAALYLVPCGIFGLLLLFFLVTGTVRTAETGLLGILAAVCVVVCIGPLGVLARRRWSIPFMYVLAVLSILNLPLGTIAALLTFFNAGKAKQGYR